MKKKNPLSRKLPRCKIHYFVNWTCPTTLSPLLGYPLMPQLLVSPSLPPNSGLLHQNTRIHLTEGEFIMNNWRHFSKTFLSNRWIMKKQPLWQVQRLQLPAWDNCKSFQTRPESCGSLSVSPREHQVQQSEISTQIAGNDSQCHSSITFAWHFPSPNQSCNQDQMSQFDASAAAGVSWGVSAFAFRREQVHSKEIGWQPWLHWKTPKPTPERNGFQGLFSSVAVCGSFAIGSA